MDELRDPDFERGLERLFAQAPEVEDPDAFVRRVDSRLTRNVRLRTVGVGVAGVLGGIIAIRQLVGSGLGPGVGLRVAHASATSARAADALYQQGWANLDLLSHITPSASLFWVASGLMILAAVVGATRILDEV
jgi:hypothetical protein